MKYIVMFSFLCTIYWPSESNAQSLEGETSYITVVVPNHFISKNLKKGEDRYVSKKSQTVLFLSKDYKGLEDSFLSASSASNFTSQMFSADETISEVTVQSEKVGKLQYSILTWTEEIKRKSNIRHMRAYNDEGEFIHRFEMSSHKSTWEQLDKEFRSFLKSIRPVK